MSALIKTDKNAIDLQNYADLRTYAGKANSVSIKNPQFAGFYDLDVSDNTSVDDGGYVIVTITGKRYKRRYSGRVNAEWYGLTAGGVVDNINVFTKSRARAGEAGTVYFPGPGVYYFAGSRPDLSGCFIECGANVTFKVDENPNTQSMKLLNSVAIENTAHGTTLIKSANVHFDFPEIWAVGAHSAGFGFDEITATESWVDWSNKIYNIATGDVTVNGTAAVTATDVTWGSDFGNPQLMLKTTPVAGALYECVADSTGVADSNQIGVFVKTTSSIWRVWIEESSADLAVRESNFSGTTVYSETHALPNGAAYGWIAGNQVNVGFVVDAANLVTVVVNGLTVYKIPVAAVNVGFVVNGDGDTRGVALRNCLRTDFYTAKSKAPMSIAVVGDSISYGAWCSNNLTDILPAFAEGLPNVGNLTISNLAVSGTSSGDWATGDESSIDLSGYKYVLCMLGTNDLQAGTAVATYLANLGAIATRVIAAGAEPIFGIFPVFTQASVSGVTGVATVNYALHAKYTHALKNWCVGNGYIFADVRRNFGANLQWYGDNIHPTVKGQIPIAAAWAEALEKAQRKKTGFLQ